MRVSVLRAAAGVLLASAVGLWGCDGGKKEPCAGVQCPAGQQCDVATGVCQAPTCNPACSGATPVCDSASLTCKTCTASTGCSGATPKCDTSANGGSGRCVTCSANSDCPSSAPVCDRTANGGVGACVACVTDTDCGGATPICAENKTCVTCTEQRGCTSPTVCDLSAGGGVGACVGCRSNTDCSGGTPLCDSTTKTCVACLADTDCSGATPACNLQTKTCVACISDTQCADPTPACDTLSSTCVTCTGNSHCSGSTPVCDTAAQGGACVECVADTDCSGSTPACEATGKTCVTCTQNSHCSGGTPLCDTSAQGGACVGCLSNTDCTNPQVCGPQKACIDPIPDTCAMAEDIVFATGSSVATFTADTSVATHDYFGTCNSTSTTSRELVYRLQLAQAQDVKVEMQAATGVDGVVYIRSSPCDSGAELGCVDKTYSGATETLRLLNLQPGDYFVFIETWGSMFGSSTVTVTLSPPTPAPTNESCSAPETIVFPSGGNVATFQADTTQAAHDETGGCNSSSTTSRELVYQLDLAQAKDVTIEAKGATGVNPVLYVRGSPCASGTELACKNATSSGGTEKVTLYDLQPGTYFVIVETYDSYYGVSDVTVTLAPPTPLPTNESCAAPETIVFPSGGSVATFQVNTERAAHDETGSCNSSTTSRELVYKLDLAQAKDVKIEAKGATGVDPVLYVRASPCDTGSELECKDAYGTNETVTLYNVQPGSYYVFVETYGSYYGLIDVTVTLSSPTLPPTNETCTSPETIVFPSGGSVATFQANTTLATHDVSGTCGGSSGVDLVYRLPLTQAQDVTISVQGPDPVIYLRASPCDTGTELACADNTLTNGTETLSLYNLAAGDYFLFIDSYGSAAGVNNVTVELSPPTPPPANQTCATAQSITLPATLAGTTMNATGDYTVASACGSAGGSDVVYTFTTATPGTLRAKVTPKVNTFRPTVSVRSLTECTSTSTNTAGCITAPASAHSADLRISELPAGTWYLVVDGASGAGGFDLEVQHTPFVVMSNDTCATAQSLTLTNGTALAMGSTKGMTNATSTSCGSGTASNPDAIYSFTTPTLSGGATGLQGKVLLGGLNASELAPVLSVRSDCAATASTDQLMCEYSSSSPFLAHDFATLSPGTTYYVVVDGNGSTLTQGSFALEVNVAPVPHPNDTCAGAMALPANTSVPGTTLGAANDFSNSTSTSWYAPCFTSSGGPGQDVVFAYTAGATKAVKIRVLPQRGYDPRLSVLSSCAQNSCLVTADPGYSSVAEEVTVNVTAGNTYYVVVDSFSDTSSTGLGGFIVSVAE